MKGLQLCFLSIILRFTITHASNSNVFHSNPGSYLKGHAFATTSVPGLHHCITSCLDSPDSCQSCNYDFVNKTCELNDADRFSSPGNLTKREGFSYSGWKYPEPKQIYTSCADILNNNRPFCTMTPNGYYNIVVRGKKRKVYCDMTENGGGWTLVSSVNGNSNAHLQSIENNCRDDDVCVEYTGNTPPQARKLSDDDIRALALVEGTFRGMVIGTSPFSVYFQFPNGPQRFSSECNGNSQKCARIITSHHYPYQWESNCKGIEVGYHLARHNTLRVFDSHDDGECGTLWKSSMFSTRRFLYGHSTGIYSGKSGYLFVK